MYAWLLRGKCSFGVCCLTLLFILVASLVIPALRQPVDMDVIRHCERSEVIQSIKPFIPISLDCFVPRNDVVPARLDCFVPRNDVGNIPRNDGGYEFRNDIKLIQAIYFGGMGVCLLGFMLSVICVLQLVLAARKITWKGYKLLITRHKINSFTFLRWIVLSEDDYLNDAEAIVTHEAVHRRKAHFIDVCLIDLLAAVYWFNPVIWLIRRELKALHEYEADKSAINKGISPSRKRL
jgi:hypothetical protein